MRSRGITARSNLYCTVKQVDKLISKILFDQRAYATRDLLSSFLPLLASLAVEGFPVSTDERGRYVAAARACTNAVAVASACGTFEVGTDASGLERLTRLPSESGAGASSSSGALRLPSDAAK